MLKRISLKIGIIKILTFFYNFVFLIQQVDTTFITLICHKILNRNRYSVSFWGILYITICPNVFEIYRFFSTFNHCNVLKTSCSGGPGYNVAASGSRGCVCESQPENVCYVLSYTVSLGICTILNNKYMGYPIFVNMNS